MSALGDVIVDALQELLRLLFSPVTTFIERHADGLVRTIVETPHPDVVFARPTNPPWPAVYDYYWGTLVPLALLLWSLAIGLVIFLEATGHLFGGYHRTKLKRRALSGLLGILSWWWLAAISLRFIDALTGVLVPSLADVSLFQTLSFAALGVLGLVLTLAIDLVLFILVAMIYFVRQVTLFLFVLLMPILIALWIPGVGPWTLVARFVRQLAGFYVPFLFMTVPVALLFRLGELLGSSVAPSLGGLGAWLAALVVPLVAVVSPFVLFWQAGALFHMADRAGRHTSRARLGDRTARLASLGRGAVRRDGVLRRGARGGARALATASRRSTRPRRLEVTRRPGRTVPTAVGERHASGVNRPLGGAVEAQPWQETRDPWFGGRESTDHLAPRDPRVDEGGVRGRTEL